MTKRKRYCRGCGERIRRSAFRCPRCRKAAMPWTYWAAGAAAAALLLFYYSC